MSSSNGLLSQFVLIFIHFCGNFKPMSIRVAIHSGYCFGVRGAIDKLEQVASRGVRTYTYGDIIHNKNVVNYFNQKGVQSVEDLSQMQDGSTVVVRAHGVPKSFYDEAEKQGFEVVDATCPFVSKIHNIVRRDSAKGRHIVVFGNAAHPEVVGIVGWCSGRAVVFATVDEAYPIDGDVSIVVQTTYDRNLWEKSQEKMTKIYPNATIYDTICVATEKRQTAARDLAKDCDIVVVVGDRKSSNTAQLLKISKQYTKSVMVESADELVLDEFVDKQRIGVIGGASTPDCFIEQVVQKLDKVRNSNDE